MTSPLLTSPHRGFFLLGTAGFILVMAWWLATQLMPLTSSLPLGWIHTWLMAYAVFTPFFCGFLFTAYPRWLGAEGPAQGLWLTALGFQAAGTVMFCLGVTLEPNFLTAGVVTWLISLSLVLIDLLRARIRGGGAWLHSVAMLLVFATGLVALALLLTGLLSKNMELGRVSVSVTFWSYLLGIFLVVAHRMVPFFAGCVLKPYVPYRPAVLLIALLLLANLQTLLRIMNQPQLQWLSLLPMALICTWLAWRWQFWRAAERRLLMALFLAWGGLIAGLAIGALQGAFMFFGHGWWAFRAPEHLIGIGFFGAMVLAMGTRVTLGHSGRALKMGGLAWWACIALLLAGVLRAMAEVSIHREPLILASASLWLAAGVLWAARFAPMLLSARADGQPG